MSTLPIRPLRAVVLLALLGGSLGTSLTGAGRTAAQELDGNVFTDAAHGWSVTFDDGFWEAEEVDEPDVTGVRLTGDGAVANLRVFDDGITDTGDCLEALVGRITDSGDVEGLEPADRTELDPPATATNAESALYVGTSTGDRDPVDVALDLECREVDRGTLAVDITIPVADYEAVTPDVEALLEGIETPDPFGSPNDDEDAEESATADAETSGSDAAEDATPAAEDAETPDADDETAIAASGDEEPVAHDDDDRLGDDRAASLDDGSYASRLGYAVTVDPDVFEITADDGSRGVDIRALDEELTVSVLAFEDASIEDCVDREVAAVRANPDNATVSVSRGARPPRTADDASGRVLRVTEDTARQGRLIIYVECRPLADEGEGGDPTFVVVRATSGAASFRTTRPLIEELLAGIGLDDDSAGDEESPTAGGDTASGGGVNGETDLAAGVYVGQVIPFRIAWDPAYWVGSETEIGVTLTAVDGASFLTVEQYSVGPGSGFSEAGCVLEPLDGFAATLPDLAETAPPGGRAIAWPDRVGNTVAAGTLTLADGTAVAQIVGVGCLELEPAQRYLRFIFSTVDIVYPVSVAELDAVLASLAVDEGDRAGVLRD